MLKKILIYWLIIVASQLWAEEYYINKIKFDGNNVISSSKLKKKLSLQTKSFSKQLLFWSKGPVYEEYYLEDDIKGIISNYQREGFLNVKVDVEKEIVKKNKINLQFHITENQYIVVQKIEFQITNADTAISEELLKLIEVNKGKWSLPSSDRFRDVEVISFQKKLYSLLMENGFPSPEISYIIILDDPPQNASIIYTISPGEFCRFGDIKITGNERTSTPIIKKQVSSNGDLFSQSELEETQRRIQHLGAFQFVTMKSLISEIDNNRIPIEILVKELPEWSVKFGIGYGLEDRFRTSIDLLKLGFLGGVRKANLFMKYSYLEPYNISLKITQPALWSTNQDLIIKPFIKKEHESAYDLESFGSTLTLQTMLNPGLTTFITYKFERDNIDLRDGSDDLLNEYYNKSNLSQGLTYENSSPAFYPDKGFMTSYILTLSGLKLRSKYHYLQGLIDLRKYIKLLPGTILASRVKLGAMKPIWGDSVTPLEERFFAGGSTSIRGWNRSEIGPKDEDDRPIGGNSYLEFSAELRYQIHKIIYLVAFMDAGNVWPEYDQHDLTDLQYSPGVGVRVKTPIGPIRIDVAKPLWQNNDRIQFHLSIGQAF